MKKTKTFEEKMADTIKNSDDFIADVVASLIVRGYMSEKQIPKNLDYEIRPYGSIVLVTLHLKNGQTITAGTDLSRGVV